VGIHARARTRVIFFSDIHGLLTLLFELPILKLETLAFYDFTFDFKLFFLYIFFYLFLKIFILKIFLKHAYFFATKSSSLNLFFKKVVAGNTICRRKKRRKKETKEKKREREKSIHYSEQGLDFLETWNYTMLMTQ